MLILPSVEAFSELLHIPVVALEEQEGSCLGGKVLVLVAKKLRTIWLENGHSQEYSKHFKDASGCYLLYLLQEQTGM